MGINQDRYTALVNAWSADLYRFAYWLSRDRGRAEDLVQETFLRAWKALPSLRDEQAAKSWLFTILRREFYRPGKMPPMDAEDSGVEDPATRSDSTRDWILRRHLHALPKEYREPLLLQVLGGYSCDDIATMLDTSRAAVMTRLFRARQKLRAALNGEATPEWPARAKNELP